MTQSDSSLLTDNDSYQSGHLNIKVGGAHALVRSAFTSFRWIAILYLVALTVAEALTNLIEPRVGMVTHGVVLVALLLHASLGAQGAQRRFLLALTLAPLIRLLSLSLPLPTFPFIY
jgi:hypothetical protein